MQSTKNYQQLVDTFKTTSKSLSLNPQLQNDITAICNYLVNPNFRIAVFGLFNHGKSTLLNAMLGDKTLPIDLIPTTGAAITVKYGTDIRTRITLTDGSEIYRSGTDILKQFAILDGDRRMRNDVTSVEVFYPHPFLKTGIEFLDLPGTNDREEQDNLVKEKLLSADLVVQLLDARKLMTLGERENLRDWLLDRGIKTVIFVANFINLLEPEEQKEVQNRLRFVAESFRAELPPGFSNLYRVDALPALRARLKGDTAYSNSSGLVEFETALQNIAGILKHDKNVSSPRVEAVARQLQELLKAKITPLQSEIQKVNAKNQAANYIKKRAETLIKQGFDASLNKLRQWLALSNLRDKYQANAAVELAKENFSSWESNTLKKDLNELQLAVVKWLHQAYEFFQQERPEDLLIPLPKHPQVIPPRNDNYNDLNEPGSIAMGSGIGWLIGGPLGAAVLGSITYLVNKNLQEQDDKVASESYHQQVARLCVDAVDGYLDNFSRQGLVILAEYERKADRVIRFIESAESSEITQKRNELRNWQNTLNQLNQELESCLGITIALQYQVDVETAKSSNNQSVYRSQGVGIKEDVGTRSNEVKQQAQVKVEVENNPGSIPSPKAPNFAEVEAKFRNWELDEEIAQMKAEMGVPEYQKQRNSSNQTKQKVEKDEVKNAYEILELQSNASIADIKIAYRKLVKKWHPDLFIGKPQLLQEAQEKMRQFNEAYKILSESDR